MNKDLTLVFSSYKSLRLLKIILKQFHNKYKTIIIENSLDKKIKNYLEKNFNNTQVIIPKENLGLAKSYNLGIKKAKTKFAFLNNPDMEISEDCQLIIFHYIKQRLVDEYEDNDPYSDHKLPKYQKRVIEDLIA